MSESSTLPANYDAQLACTLQIQAPLTLTPTLTNPDSNPDSLTLTLTLTLTLASPNQALGLSYATKRGTYGGRINEPNYKQALDRFGKKQLVLSVDRPAGAATVAFRGTVRFPASPADSIPLDLSN